jgi:tRNA 2-thiouridine synthesizing protein B
MATLHLINAPTPDSAALSNCLRAARDGDTVLLIGNGVFCAVADSFTRVRIGKTNLSWCALSEDVESRAIAGRIATSVQLVDDTTFVDLVARHQPVVSWS